MPPRSTPELGGSLVAQQRPAGTVQHQVTGAGHAAVPPVPGAARARPAAAAPSATWRLISTAHAATRGPRRPRRSRHSPHPTHRDGRSATTRLPARATAAAPGTSGPRVHVHRSIHPGGHLHRPCSPTLVGDGGDRRGRGLGIEVVAARVTGLKSASRSYCSGMPVGRLTLAMPSSLMSSSILTTARSELPCAATSTVLPASQVVEDRAVQVGLHPGDDVGQALGLGGAVAEIGIPGVVGLGELVGVADRRRRGVVRAAPEHELLLAVLLQGLLLVLALQVAVVPLVEPPGPADRDPVPVGRIEREVGRGDGPTQQRGVQRRRAAPRRR